jgi:hypothetical protein
MSSGKAPRTTPATSKPLIVPWKRFQPDGYSRMRKQWMRGIGKAETEGGHCTGSFPALFAPRRNLLHLEHLYYANSYQTSKITYVWIIPTISIIRSRFSFHVNSRNPDARPPFVVIRNLNHQVTRDDAVSVGPMPLLSYLVKRGHLDPVSAG